MCTAVLLDSACRDKKSPRPKAASCTQYRQNKSNNKDAYVYLFWFLKMTTEA